jgi:hypothetical protein
MKVCVICDRAESYCTSHQGQRANVSYRELGKAVLIDVFTILKICREYLGLAWCLHCINTNNCY